MSRRSKEASRTPLLALPLVEKLLSAAMARGAQPAFKGYRGFPATVCISINEEIEGRTAVTLMSKPVSRRQFLMGKFVGILTACQFAPVLLFGAWAGLVADRAEVATVLNTRSVQDLPNLGRNATNFVLLAPGTVASTFQNSIGENPQQSTAISANGQSPFAAGSILDGADNNDSFSNVNLPFPFPDALQEFSVQTNGLSAQFGLHPGSVVNVITKSGTNQFHGGLFEFVRNGAFNARNFFAATQDTLRRNQFGGTLGAPIKKDKLFGFFGYQRTIVRTAPPQSLSFVPTQAALSGDFSGLESAACQSTRAHRAITNPATGQPFANDFVSPSLFSPQALNLAKYLPVSNDPCGQIRYGIPNPSEESQYIGRVDWQQSARNTFFGRYFLINFTNPPLFDGKNGLTTTLAGQAVRSQSLVLGDNYSITPSIVNTARITGTRLRDNRSAASNLFNLADAGVNIFQFDPHFINLSVTGAFAFGCGNCATARSAACGALPCPDAGLVNIVMRPTVTESACRG